MSAAATRAFGPSGAMCCATLIGSRRWRSPRTGGQMTLRTPATGVIGPLFKAARMALPPNVRDASAA